MIRVPELVASMQLKRSIARLSARKVRDKQKIPGFFRVQYKERDGVPMYTPPQGTAYESYTHPQTGEPLFRPVVVY